ncbi:OsmC family protein [Enterococcus sp. DIV1420a]|uniref:OsmC family protein n=1 Tax=Enterococcus sp. DIV1420a TaxID=2774672 RepID=UPI003F277EAF
MSKLITNWYGGRTGLGQIEKDTIKVPIAIPKKLEGSGEGFNPKELLCMATGSCFFLTLVHLIETRKITIEKLMMESEIIKDQDSFKIKHAVTLVLSKQNSIDEVNLVNRTIDVAELTCGIGKLVKAGGATIMIEKNISISDENSSR